MVVEGNGVRWRVIYCIFQPSGIVTAEKPCPGEKIFSLTSARDGSDLVVDIGRFWESVEERQTWMLLKGWMSGTLKD